MTVAADRLEFVEALAASMRRSGIDQATVDGVTLVLGPLPTPGLDVASDDGEGRVLLRPRRASHVAGRIFAEVPTGHREHDDE